MYLFSEPKCPNQCECFDFGKCKWSANLMKQMENARSANNGKLWQSYFNRFKEHICSFEDQKVCCCGTQQIAPDELGLPDTTSLEKIPSTTEGKYHYC